MTQVCCCENFPGMHHFEASECESGNIFKPTSQDLADMESCDHDVVGGVCMACGKVIDE